MSKLPLPRPISSNVPLAQRLQMPKRAKAVRTLVKPAYRGRSVGTFVPKITQKVFEKFGFSTATLLTDWAIIVGGDLAAYTAPERLKWPRGFEGAADSGEAGPGRSGATLMLRVEPARALDIQYKARLLIDRINAYFGYRAVADLRILQAPIDARFQKLPPPTPAPILPVPADVMAVADPDLRAALERMAQGVLSRARSAAPMPKR